MLENQHLQGNKVLKINDNNKKKKKQNKLKQDLLSLI
jgi:hypothetical protein